MISSYIPCLFDQIQRKGHGWEWNGMELGGRVNKGFWSHLQTDDYYWDMLFECIYNLVSAAHSEDHQELSMPKVI